MLLLLLLFVQSLTCIIKTLFWNSDYDNTKTLRKKEKRERERKSPTSQKYVKLAKQQLTNEHTFSLCVHYIMQNQQHKQNQMPLADSTVHCPSTHY